MDEISKIELKFAYIIVLWCYNVVGTNAFDLDSTDLVLYKKVKSIENSLLHNENLSKFINISHIDNETFANDATKSKRSYDNTQCIKDLERIQQDFKQGMKIESKTKNFLIRIHH